MNCFQLLNFVAPETLIIAAAPAGEPAIEPASSIRWDLAVLPRMILPDCVLFCVLGASNIIGF